MAWRSLDPDQYFCLYPFQHVYYYHSFTAWPRCKWYDRKFSFHCRSGDIVLDPYAAPVWFDKDPNGKEWGRPGNDIYFTESNFIY